MGFNIELTSIAEVEMWNAIDWYDDQREDLGKLFARAFQNAIQVLQKNPNTFPVGVGKKRKLPTKGFPYLIIYEVQENTVFVLGVFHTSRNPKSWKSR